MISFAFRVNRSFREYATHPITIPKSQVDYRQLERELAGGVEGDLRFPDGSSVPAFVYGGVAGYGPYFQIRSQRYSPWVAQRTAVGDLIEVDLSSERGRLAIVARSR